MALTKLTTNSIKDGEVKTADILAANVTEAKLATDSITTAKILDGTVAVADLNATQDWSSKTLTIADSAFNNQNFNIALLGFKMAVNDSITVFNLVDGVVDEFHDESGADEGEGSNDTYCSSSDWYINSTQPDGASLAYSAGFSMPGDSVFAVSEADTSVAGCNPSQTGGGTWGTFTVPTGITATDIKVWGAGAGAGPGGSGNDGGGGGYVEGTLAVTASQVLYVGVGEGGVPIGGVSKNGGFRGGGGSNDCHPSGSSACLSSGGGAGGVFSHQTGCISCSPQAPRVYAVAGAGGAGGIEAGPGLPGGGGGGLIGMAAAPGGAVAQSSRSTANAGGGSQTAGGQTGSHGQIYCGQGGSFLSGGKGADTPQGQAGAGGGSGYYGGGGGGGAVTAPTTNRGHGGGGSSYFGHPQITSGSTVAVPGAQCGPGGVGGGLTQPGYLAGTNEGGARPTGAGQKGYALLTATASATATTTNVISNAFTAGSAPTTARIVVFEENVDTPTLNTDIIASVSRDGGTTFTTATLSDSGYVAGTSGQRILTGTATVSGQPSGTSMRWKLALANNQVKIHGVSLAWA